MIDAKKLGWRRFDDPERKILSGVSMRDNFKIGDHVSWNSEAGRLSGRSFVCTLAISRSKATRTMRVRKRLNTKSRAAGPSTSHSTRDQRSPSFATDAPSPGAIDDRQHSPDAQEPATSFTRAAPCQSQRCGRSYTP